MAGDVFGIIFANLHDHRICELTRDRCTGSIPVGGRYRLIDFVLSGFSGAGIINTAVITRSNYKSLLDHLGSGREWDLSRKRGGLMILPPAALSDWGDITRSRIDALSGVLSIIRDLSAGYVVIADCDGMANIDFADFVDAHIHSGAEITVMYQKQKMALLPDGSVATFSVNAHRRVTGMRIGPQPEGEQNVWMNIFILNRDVLEWMVRDCISRNLNDIGRDMLQHNLDRFVVYAYEFTGCALRFHSLKEYYEANLALLNPTVRAELFPSERPVCTRVLDDAPVRYGLNARVQNALLADGCVIEGEVENSLLFRGVHVARGAVVKNCVLMQGTQIGEDALLNCVVSDKRVIIRAGRLITGAESCPTYIAKGAVV